LLSAFFRRTRSRRYTRMPKYKAKHFGRELF
jgi:hypothetical protein